MESKTLISEAAAKSWDEYIEKTSQKYKGLTDAGKEVDEAYVKNFVEKYRNIVQKYEVFQKQENNPVAEKAAGIFSEMMAFTPGMTDSFSDFKKWYMKFNKSDLGKMYREIDTFADNPKYVSAVAIMDMINSTDVVFEDLMVPKKMELPPKIEELPPAEKEEKIEKAGEKIQAALRRAIVEPAKNFGSKFKKEDSDKPKEAEDIVKALPKEDRKEVEKTRAEVEKEFLDKYDTNKDGKLSAMEITLMNMKKRGEI
jgi:hypothetical protein